MLSRRQSHPQLRTVCLERAFLEPLVVKDKVFLFPALCRLILLVYLLFSESKYTFLHLYNVAMSNCSKSF